MAPSRTSAFARSDILKDFAQSNTSFNRLIGENQGLSRAIARSAMPRQCAYAPAVSFTTLGLSALKMGAAPCAEGLVSDPTSEKALIETIRRPTRNVRKHLICERSPNRKTAGDSAGNERTGDKVQLPQRPKSSHHRPTVQSPKARHHMPNS